MKSYKTTIIGLALAIFTALQPIFEGESVQFDRRLICRMALASLIAIFGFYAKDHDVTGR
tara:strand:+ start:210 stop:389 length:180 start_codon:yes stop_codon:yes gene_type:complete